jgi:hypothetical protein
VITDIDPVTGIRIIGWIFIGVTGLLVLVAVLMIRRERR